MPATLGTMILSSLLLIAAPVLAADLPGLPGSGSTVAQAAPAETKPAESAAPAAPVTPAPEPPKAAEPAKPVLMPPAIPARPAGTLDTAAEVAKDLAVRVQYFEDGQSYYRAYTKGGSHSAEENKAFLRFLEEYERELEIARKVHTLLGVWLEKKSSIKD